MHYCLRPLLPLERWGALGVNSTNNVSGKTCFSQALICQGVHGPPWPPPQGPRLAQPLWWLRRPEQWPATQPWKEANQIMWACTMLALFHCLFRRANKEISKFSNFMKNIFADLWMEYFNCCSWHRHFVISLCIRKNFFLRNLSCSYNCLPLLLRLIVCLLLSGGEQLYSKGQSKFTWLPQAVGWLAIFWQYSSNSSCVIGSPLELVMNGK